MKNFKKNVFGFAHHALLGLVVVAIIVAAGLRVLAGTHAEELSSNYNNGKIYDGKFTINPDGSDYQKLSNLPNHFQAVYSNMSFDGKTVAYWVFTDNLSSVLRKATISSSGTLTNVSQIARIPNDEFANLTPPVWSPDGKKVAEMIFQGKVQKILIARTDIVDINPVQNVDSKPVLNIGWRPASVNIIYARPNDGIAKNTQICTISTGGENNECNSVSISTPTEAAEVDGFTVLGLGGLAVSPTGGKVALIAFNNSTTSQISSGIFTVKPDGSDLKRPKTFPTHQQVRTVVWSPDGTKIAYLLEDRRNSNNSGLYVMNADGSNLKPVKTGVAAAEYNSSYPLSWAHK